MERVIRLTASASLKEKRLQGLLEGRSPVEPRLSEAVEDAQILGSLELAGLSATLPELEAARQGGEAPAAVVRLLKALRAVDARAPFGVAALRSWSAAVSGGAGSWRTS